MTFVDIAKEFGRSKTWVAEKVYEMIDDGLLERRAQGGEWTQEEIEQLKRLRAEGYTLGQIADKTGRSYKAVDAKLRRL